MSRKRQKRINTLSDELVEVQQLEADRAVIASKADDELFHIDTVGSKNVRRKMALEKEAKAVTLNRQLMRKKVVDKISANIRAEHEQLIEKSEKIYDAWDAEPVSSRQRRGVKKPVNVSVLPGISYNPSERDHQDALAEASAVELRHREQQDQNASVGRLEDIPQVDEARDDESGLSDESEREEDSSSNRIFRSSKPLTKAQKNRRRLRMAAERERSIAQKEEQLLKSIDRLNAIVKDVEINASQNEALAEYRKQRKDETARVVARTMSIRDVAIVPLSDELNGSLRLLKPKGSRVVDQLGAFVSTGAAIAKGHRKRKSYEKPHAAPNIKWVPKK